MRQSLGIQSPDLWQSELGLLPVPLFDTQFQDNKFVLLNGRIGNFCLDLGNESDDNDPRNLAWSSDVGHYVKLSKEIVEVYRWDKKPSSLERYSKKSVEDNLEKFYDYLQKDQPSRDLSIISFAIKVFRTLRGVLGGNCNGHQSLRAFLYLLACVSDEVNRNELIIEKWGLSSDIQPIVESVNDLDWESLISDLRDGTSFYGLKPNISLLFRHASGTLFQEAHYEAYTFQSEPLLPGFLPDPVSVKKETKLVGIYYTPPSIARTLVEEALNAVDDLPSTLNLKVFDPACGSGIFLKEILRQLSLKNYEGRLELVGWDISPAAIDMARFILTYEKVKLADQFSVEIEISHQDSLDETNQWSDSTDIILMNPPFLSWNDMDKQQRDLARRTLDNLWEKTPDLSSLFLWKGVQNLSSKGVIACILPASILNAQSYLKLRQAILPKVDICLIGKLGNPLLFSNATIDTAIWVAKSPKVNQSALALWADHRPESSSSVLRALRQYTYCGRDSFNVIDKSSFSIYENPSLSENLISWVPRSYQSFRLLKQLEWQNFSKVKDIFDVREGVSTGNNAVFILSNKIFENLPNKEKKFFRPAIITESINSSRLFGFAYVFYPYGENIPKIQSENDLKKYVGSYYNDYLLKNRHKLVSRPRKNETNWWTLNEYRAWQVEKIPKLVSTHFGKVGSFAWDDSGKYVVINGFAWFPRKENNLSEYIGLAYLAILSCPFVNDLLASVSNVVAGGQWDLSKRYISNMFFPNLMAENFDSKMLESLHEVGKLIHSGQDFVTIQVWLLTHDVFYVSNNKQPVFCSD